MISLITLQSLLTIVAILDLEIDQLDLVSAFLNGDMDTVVFLTQPEEWTIEEGFSELIKSLDRLCQVSKIWYEVLDTALQELGFKCLMVNLAAWTSPTGTYVVAHIDDMLTAGSRTEIDAVKKHLATKFKLKDLGAAKVLVGLDIVRDRPNWRIYIDQMKYANKVWVTYGMQNVNPCFLPINVGEKLSKAEGALLNENKKRLYPAIVGSLGYLMNCSRPDIAFAVSRLAQFASCPTERYMIAVRHVCRYLKETVDTRVLIGEAKRKESAVDQEVVTYFDSSFADDP